MKSCPNLLLIAGTGRNSGKTTLACELIGHFAKQFPLIAIKISPHQHNHTSLHSPVFKNAHSAIYEESDMNLPKDSSRMLAAGASKVYYIESEDQNLEDIFNILYAQLPADMPIVCESPSLIKVVTPGLFFIADHENVINKKQYILEKKTKADLVFDYQHGSTSSLIQSIIFSNSKWQMKK